jgi:hypothetical protein
VLQNSNKLFREKEYSPVAKLPAERARIASFKS